MYSDAGARGATDAAAQAHVSEVRETAAEGEEATGEPGAAKPVGAEERAEPPAGEQSHLLGVMQVLGICRHHQKPRRM